MTLTNTALTGSELLTKIKELSGVSKTALVRGCGYVSTKADGTERVNFTAFYEALLNAKGVTFNEPANDGRPGRQPSFVTRVHFNGNLLVGKAYTAQMGLRPGDQFEIKLGKNNQFRLIPIASEEVAA